jgi:adenosine deaminase
MEVRRRQDFVLERLAVLGTVIETCPTSNLRIGGVPSPAEHPVHRFLRSDVNLVISADDPGTFDAPLAAEVEWVLAHTGYDPTSLVERLGDPRRFRFQRDL